MAQNLPGELSSEISLGGSQYDVCSRHLPTVPRLSRVEGRFAYLGPKAGFDNPDEQEPSGEGFLGQMRKR